MKNSWPAATGSLFKGLSVVTFGNVLGEVLRFIRNVIVARILSPEDFGIAATFWITTGFLMSVSELGVQQMLVRDKDGDDEHFGAVAQSVLLVRGTIIGALIFLFAGPVAALFDIPEATWAFRLLAIIPVISGFQHRDIIRRQRNLEFTPFVLSKILPDITITLLAWPISYWSGNYTAFLYIAILHGIIWVISSHLLARRPFLIAWDVKLLKKFFNFGWPLLLNGILMFTVLQGDRIILAKGYTKAELGVYSVALSIAMLAPTMLGGILSQISLPYLSRLQDNRIQFEKNLNFLSKIVALTATLIASALLIAGPIFISIIYGTKYDLAGVVIGLLGIMHSIRLIRQLPTIASISLGQTSNALYANILRQSGLILAVFVALFGGGLRWIAVSGIIGEIIALLSIVSIVKIRLNIPFRLWIKSFLGFSTTLFVVVAISHFLSISRNFMTTGISLLVCETLVICGWFLFDKSFCKDVIGLLKKRSIE